jgi:hypothetical protein
MRFLVCRKQESVQFAFQDIRCQTERFVLCAQISHCSRLGNKVCDEHRRISGHKSPRRKIWLTERQCFLTMCRNWWIYITQHSRNVSLNSFILICEWTLYWFRPSLFDILTDLKLTTDPTALFPIHRSETYTTLSVVSLRKRRCVDK